MIRLRPPLNCLPVRAVRPVCTTVLFPLLLVGLMACSQKGQSAQGSRMRVSVGEIKEVAITPPGGNAPLVGTSDNQEVVDVSQRPFTAADSSAMQQGTVVPAVFLIKGVTIGTARVVLSEKTTGQAANSRVRKAYVVQVVSK